MIRWIAPSEQGMLKKYLILSGPKHGIAVRMATILSSRSEEVLFGMRFGPCRWSFNPFFPDF
jgi:hypothetical protein